MTAIFGGLFGLAVLASLIALLIQVVPPRDERAMVTSATASATAGETAQTPAPSLFSKKKRTPVPGPWRLSELEKDPSAIVARGVIERQSFVDALADKNVPKAQSYRIMKAFEGIRKFDKCGKKDHFAVAMDKASHRVRAFEYEISPSEVYQAREDGNGLLVGQRLDMKIADEETIGAFYVSSDLAASYPTGGFEDGLLTTLNEALNGRMSTESFEEGATVRVIAIEETALGLFSRYKRITAFEYRPPDPAAKATRVYYFEGEQSHGYFDERGRQPSGDGWRSPIQGAPVTSKFNPKRMHPLLHKIMPHQGTDFGAAMGTPVYSAYRGIVDWVGPQGPGGNLVTIAHPNGVTTGYAHLSRFAAGIKKGDKVGTHTLVGYVGSTGRSTGPHLHFSAKRDGKFFDAETLGLDAERVLPPGDRPTFLNKKAELDKRLDAIPLPEPPPEKPKPTPVASASASAGPAAAVPVAAGASSAAANAPSGFVEDSSEDDAEDPPATPPQK